MGEPVAKSPQRFNADDASIPIDAKDLAALARRYADQSMYDEAIHLYEMACKLTPGSVSLRINLARVVDLKKQSEATRVEQVRRDINAKRSRDEIDSSQYIGLAQHYIEKDQTTKAIELLEIAKLKTPQSPPLRDSRQTLLLGGGNGGAVVGRDPDRTKVQPVRPGAGQLSGRIQFELKRFGDALDDFIDAFLLSTDQKGEGSEPIRRMINTLKRILSSRPKS